MTEANVDDSFGSGNDIFMEFMLRTQRKFDSKPEELPFSSDGIEISNMGMIPKMLQTSYINKFEVLPHDSTFKTFRSIRHQFSWLHNCMPDVLAIFNIISQVTQAKFIESYLLLSKIVKYLQVRY